MLAILVSGMASLHAQDHDFEVDGIYYNIISLQDLTAEVCGSDGSVTDLYIPGEVVYNRRTLKVLSVGNSAFNKGNLTSVVIGEGVEEIKANAFLRCEEMKSATVPASVTNIGTGAFSRMSLASIVFSDGQEILNIDRRAVDTDLDTYGDHRNLKSIYLGRNIATVGNEEAVFGGEVEVTDFTVGRFVTDLKEIPFDVFGKLQTITLNTGTPPATAENFTMSQYLDVSVNIPRGSLDAYQNDPVWGQFWNLVEIDPDNAATVTISESGYSSFACKSGLDFSGYYDLEAFTGHLNGDRLTLSSVLKVPAETGIILKGTPGKTYVIPYADVEGGTASSDLKAVMEDTEVNPLKANYVLAHVDGVPGFYRYTGTTITAGHAYLELDAGVSDSKIILLDFGGTTGIKDVEAETGADAFYDLSGRRVAMPGSGLYIKNGRKVIIK